MEKVKNKALLLLVFAALMAFFSCGPESGDEEGSTAYILSVRPGDRGYEVSTNGGDLGGGWEVDYPGVTAYYANHSVRPKNVAISANGETLTMKLCSDSQSDIERLWMKVKVSGDAELVTLPDSADRNGKAVFVIGPLEANGCRTVNLDFNLTGDRYEVRLFLMEVMERLAYITDKHDPDRRLFADLVTMNADKTGYYRFSKNMEPTRHLFPAWSPGGEWIAYNRLEDVEMGGETLKREQLFIAHPDGGSFRHVSEGLFFASEAFFNPTGKLIIFDCKWDDVQGSEICMYDVRTEMVFPFITGDGYYNGLAFYGRWSPDGKHLVFGCWGPDNTKKTRTWMHVRLNPRTGDTLDVPEPILKGDKDVKKPDGNNYSMFVENWAWAPDSRHAAIEVYQYRSWNLIFRGLAIVDLEEIMNSSLPDVPDLVQVADHSVGGHAENPRFNSDGSRLYFDHFVDGNVADVQYVELENYQPVSGRISLVENGHYNRNPAPFPVILETYYPNGL